MVELDHALNARESHQIPITEVVGTSLFSQGENAGGALGKRWLGSGVPAPAFHSLWQPLLGPHLNAHLGDVLNGSCQGFCLCRVLHSEVLTKVTEQLPVMRW